MENTMRVQKRILNEMSTNMWLHTVFLSTPPLRFFIFFRLLAFS